MGGAATKIAELNKTFFDAIESNDVNKVNELLKIKNLDINTQMVDKKTALHLAKSKAMTEILMDAGADVMVRDSGEKTPLHYADNKEIAEFLLQSGAEVNAVDKRGSTPLHVVKNMYVTRVLIANGANVNAVDKCGSTPLHVVKNVDVAQVLIAGGANVNAKIKLTGYTPLHCIKDPNMVNILVSKGADLQALSIYQRTPLASALSDGRILVAHRIIDHLSPEQLKNKPEFLKNSSCNLQASKYWDYIKESREVPDQIEEGSVASTSLEIAIQSVPEKAAEIKKETAKMEIAQSMEAKASTSNDMEISCTPPSQSRLKDCCFFTEVKEEEKPITESTHTTASETENSYTPSGQSRLQGCFLFEKATEEEKQTPESTHSTRQESMA